MQRLIHLWQANDFMLKSIFDGFTPEQFHAQPAGLSKAVWQIGHLLGSIYIPIAELDPEFKRPERNPHFDQGSKPEDVPSDVDAAALLEQLHTQHARLVELLEAASEEDMARPLDWEPPFGPATVAGAVHFLYMHETYHIGQCGVIRRALGLGGWLPG